MKKFTRKLFALTMSILLLLSISIPVSAATTHKKENIVESLDTSIPSFGNVTVSAGYSHSSNAFVVRSNTNVRLDLNILLNESDYELIVILEDANTGANLQSAKFTQSGSYTFNISEGGTYQLLFKCINGSYTFNYTITF